jgi:adenylate cyclase
MTADTPAAKRLSRWKSSPRFVSLLIVVGVFACLLAVQRLGWLQVSEFQAYDFFIRHQPKAATSDPIILVEMTEADIHDSSLDWPLYDVKLAELLRRLEADKPAAIGLDIWRDIPVPKNGAGIRELNEVLLGHDNIGAIFTLDGIKPPSSLGFDPGRVAFNDNLPTDHMVDRTVPKVRRTMLFGTHASGETFSSLPFWLALRFLQEKGIEPEFDSDSVFRLGKARLEKLRPNDGAYVRADDTGWQMLLDFKCPDTFARFTVTEALSGKIPAGTLRDKIVIIGINTASVFDERVTPVRARHRGPELQAAIVNQLLRLALQGERPLRFWGNWQEDLWMLVWCLVGGAIGYRVQSPWRFVVETLVCLLVIGGVAWLAFANGWWIPLAGPALAYAPAAALVTTYITVHERSMRAVLMKLYSRHVSKEIAESTWAHRDSFLDGGRPMAQKLVVTVLFTDLKGFSTISEKMDPPQLYRWLNGYLGAMAQVVQEHGGVLKQFTGDGIMALFGVPVPHNTSAEQSADAAAAVRCALAMGRRLVELIHGWQEAGLPAVSIRAGIYTGEVAAGSVGSDDRFEYAVIGDVVNTASRLESYDKTLADPDLLPNRCRIFIGEPTHNLLNGGFVSKQIGMLEVKGKANKVSVFQVLEERTPDSGTAAIVASGASNPHHE